VCNSELGHDPQRDAANPPVTKGGANHGGNEVKIYSPEGRVGTAPIRLAPEPRKLSGSRIAVLDNGKPGARWILERIAGRLEERGQSRFIGHFRKRTAATACEDALLSQIAADADLVITGVAD
jgi:hypothetical protein